MSWTPLPPSARVSNAAPDAGADRVSAFLWRRLPNRLARVSSKLADVFADGRHFGTLRFAGWLTPFAALLTGFIAGRNHDMFTYITSLSVMAAVLVVGMQGGAFGLWALGGYIIGDLQNPAQDDLIRVTIGNFGLADRWAQYYYPHLLSYAVLGLLVVVNPLAARAIGASVRFAKSPIAWVASAVVTAVAAAFLSYLWARSAQYLIRPLWTLRDDIAAVPPLALQPLKDHAAVLAWAGGVAGFVGVAIEAVVTLRLPVRVRALTPAPRGAPSLRSLIVAAPLKGIAAAAMMTGVLEHWSAGIKFAAAVTAVELVRTVLMPRMPVVPGLLERVPVVLRLAAAMIIAYEVTKGYIYHSALAFSVDFTPLVIGAFVGYAVAAVLFPGPVRPPRPVRPVRRRGTAVLGHPAVVVALVAAAWLTVRARPAYADDCSGFSDCSLSQKGAMWATGGLFGLAAGAILANRRGAAKSAAAQKAQDDLERLGKELAKGGQDVGKTSPEAKKVQDAIDKAKKIVEGVNPGKGKNNCALVSDAVDQRFGGEVSPIAPKIGDDTIGTPAGDSERWDGHGHTWKAGAGPPEAAEWARETGGRGILHIDWADGGGHVINVVPVDGTVLFIDGQQNPPAVSSTLEGLYGRSQVDGITGYAFLPTWPPG